MRKDNNRENYIFYNGEAVKVLLVERRNGGCRFESGLLLIYFLFFGGCNMSISFTIVGCLLFFIFGFFIGVNRIINYEKKNAAGELTIMLDDSDKTAYLFFTAYISPEELCKYETALVRIKHDREK